MSAQTQANFQTVSLSRSVDYSETIDLVTQWRQGDVLRLHDSEEGPNSFANDWLLIKHSLSMPVVDDATGDRFLAQVLALRRGFQKIGYSDGSVAVWVTVPRFLTLGEPFVLYKEPPYSVWSVESMQHNVIDRIESVGGAYID
ncbi:MAG: hypothetical protein KA604_04075 [Candidatus Saccharimonas sp.]|nr:hypothetical protein [Candidatus Saccharimonas sp.]